MSARWPRASSSTRYSLLIFTFRDGLIVKQEAYDCYLPFAPARMINNSVNRC